MSHSNKIHATSVDYYKASEVTRISSNNLNFFANEMLNNPQESSKMNNWEDVLYEEESELISHHYSDSNKVKNKQSSTKLNIDFSTVSKGNFRLNIFSYTSFNWKQNWRGSKREV